MKTYLTFACLACLLLLVWCNLSSDGFTIKVKAIHTSWKTLSYTIASKVFSWAFTGNVKKEKISDTFWDEVINWYAYLYTFEDMWIAFHFWDIAAEYADPTTPYFFEPYMYYSGNSIFYQKKDPTSAYPALSVFSKHTGDNILHAIQVDHTLLLKNWCSATLWQNDFPLISWNREQYNIYHIEEKDSNACFPWLFFVEDKRKPDRYYMIFHPDACAPSCSTFTKINFF